MIKFFCPILYIILAFYSPLTSHAQKKKFTISGYVQDSTTGERMIGANVYETNNLTGTTTNTYGFFSFTLPSDTVTIAFSFVGYQAKYIKMILDNDTVIKMRLVSSVELKEVEIIAEGEKRIEEVTRMSTIDIPLDQIKSIPALMGEVDVMKALQLLPGVQSGGEGSSGLYVRGGGPDQNLILLDEAPVYNVSHLFGFFSVFNADAIKNVEITKGGFPARFGGRLSSVVEINMKEGNMNKLSGQGSIGTVSSKFTLEGPLRKERTSFIISGRRTYLDLLMRPFLDNERTGIFGYYFYDLNAKINHIVSEKDRIYFSIYGGDDKFYGRQSESWVDNGVDHKNTFKFGLGWGNITSTVRWNHILTKKLFANATGTFSKYHFLTDESDESVVGSGSSKITDSFYLKYYSGIRDWSGKIDFDWLPSPAHYVKFGGSGIFHTFSPGALQYKTSGTGTANFDTTLGSRKTYSHEYTLFLEDDFKVNSRLKINAGLHGSAFYVNEKLYYSVQPRFSGRYFVTEHWALKGSYAKMQQYIHLLSNSNVGLPTDLWVPSTEKVQPQKSEQQALGVARTFFNNKFEFSVEGYYKTMQNLIEYSEGADFIDPNSDWQTKIETGKGWAYGTEIFIQKKKGKTTGWIGYTLAWSHRQFAKINNGKEYPYKFDRRHDLSFVASHRISDYIDIAATWVYGTGNAITIPVARYYGQTYQPGGGTLWETDFYGAKNGFRMRAYHRLDVGVNFHKQKKWGSRTWNVSVYNLYNRKNPYFIYSGFDKSGYPALKQVSLFPIIPSVTYSFKF